MSSSFVDSAWTEAVPTVHAVWAWPKQLYSQKWIYELHQIPSANELCFLNIEIDNGTLCLCTIWIWKVMGLCNEACRIHVQFLIFVFTVSSFWIFPFSHDQTTLSQHHIMMHLSVVLINSFNDTQKWMTTIIFR